MSTAVDICNLALSLLGDEATLASIDPPEGSAQADHCARWYPIARDQMLEARDWSRARRIQAAPASLANKRPDWAYSYAMPTDCLAVRRLVPSTLDASEMQAIQNAEFLGGLLAQADVPFDTYSDDNDRLILLTNTLNPTVIYTFRMTNPAKLSKMMESALIALLAHYLAGPVLKGASGRKASIDMLNLYNLRLSQASAADANQSNFKREYQPAAMRARGVYFPRHRVVGS